jgi:hypothetical protein
LIDIFLAAAEEAEAALRDTGVETAAEGAAPKDQNNMEREIAKGD